MKVTFKRDWTFAGREGGIFYMKEFKAGQTIRLTRAQYARAKAHGAIEDGNQDSEPSQAIEEAAQPAAASEGGNESGNPAERGGVGGDAEEPGAI